jgi:hypothetical protein
MFASRGRQPFEEERIHAEQEFHEVHSIEHQQGHHY